MAEYVPYHIIIQTPLTTPSLHSHFLSRLSSGERLVLSYIIDLLHDILRYEPSTKMSSLALAIVLAPTLIKGPDPLEDASLCLEPGKKLPEGMIGSGRFNDMGGNTVVGVLEMGIRLGNAED